MGTKLKALREEQRRDLNIHCVRWLFNDHQDSFRIELRHGRLSGLRKIYVNGELQVRVKEMASMLIGQRSAHEFRLRGPVTGRQWTGKVVIKKTGLLEHLYQLFIGDRAIEILSLDSRPVPTRAHPLPSLQSKLPRRHSFSRSSSTRTAHLRRAAAHQLTCFHTLVFDKGDGKVPTPSDSPPLA